MKDQDQRFCEEYLLDLNAVQAALRAGFAPSTARHASAWINARNPRKPEMRAEIDRLMAERSRRTGVNADEVVQELARIAFADGAEGGVRTQEKIRALELLGKHLGLFTENVRVQQVLPVIIDDVKEAANRIEAAEEP